MRRACCPNDQISILHFIRSRNGNLMVVSAISKDSNEATTSDLGKQLNSNQIEEPNDEIQIQMKVSKSLKVFDGVPSIDSLTMSLLLFLMCRMLKSLSKNFVPLHRCMVCDILWSQSIIGLKGITSCDLQN